jgi:hypothetical protein
VTRDGSFLAICRIDVDRVSTAFAENLATMLPQMGFKIASFHDYEV